MKRDELSKAHGGAVVIFEPSDGCWMLPGGRRLYSEAAAEQAAVKINALMHTNKHMRGTGISREVVER